MSPLLTAVPRVTPSGALTIVELEGDTASFRFLVERANPPLLPQDVQWTMNGDALNETNPRYSFSADRLRLVVSALTRFDEGQYTVSVRNAAGVNSSSISLDVQCKSVHLMRLSMQLYFLQFHPRSLLLLLSPLFG